MHAALYRRFSPPRFHLEFGRLYKASEVAQAREILPASCLRRDYATSLPHESCRHFYRRRIYNIREIMSRAILPRFRSAPRLKAREQVARSMRNLHTGIIRPTGLQRVRGLDHYLGS